MLVLKRKKDESIIIGDNIKITIIQCDDGNVKLGIDAPKNVKVHREEVLLEIINENKDAIKVNKDAIKDLKDMWKK